MIWLWAFLIMALIEWIAAGKQLRKIRWFTKPVSLLLLIAWFTAEQGWQQPGTWFGLGLIFSLIGDIFLLLRARYFLAGLFAFLSAHICYIVGFSQGHITLSWGLSIPIVVLVLIGVLAYPRIIRGVRRRIEFRRLTIPVIFYMLTISLMLLTALLTWFRPQWPINAALFASLGAILFTISDSLLAAGRFLHPIRYGNFMVMFSYHLGQLGITISALIATGHLLK